MINSSPATYEVREQIAYITLNRPEKGNALNPELCTALGKTWARFEKDGEARVAIFSGAGKNFCTGLDLATGADGDRVIPTAIPAHGVKVLKPIVGLVRGWAIGAGYVLATQAADITIASENARFAFPEAKVGVMSKMDWSINYSLFKKTLELLLTGETISAQEACCLGLVNRVVPENELLAEGLRLAEVIKGNAPLALRAIKYAMYKTAASASANEYETWVKPQYESEDLQEGLRAFNERRKPYFKGK
jgi:enoyl-CoA hydratase